MESNEHGHPAAYLGDGAYASFDPALGEVILYTSDGMSEQNRVVLGPREFSELLRFFVALGLQSQYLVKP